MGTMARTAVVAGTATAVAGSVSGKQQAKAQQQAQAVAAQQQQEAAAQQAAIDQSVAEHLAAQTPAPPPPPPTADDPLARLQQLAEMKQQGLLTDAEFTAMKAKLVGI